MALIRPGGGGPGPVPGGANPPTPPSWFHPGTTPPDAGGPAWHFPPAGMPTMPGNLGVPQGHPSSYYTNGGAASPPANTTAGVGWHITGSTHPALQHILGTTSSGLPNPGGWQNGPPAWWPQGAPWPPPWRNPGGDPYGPPTPAPGNAILNYLRGYYQAGGG